jgi:glycosidase
MGIDNLDTVTNYEIYKGLYSGHNDKNYFEIAHSLSRLFGEHGLLKGSLLYNFLDNHDVSRIASMIKQKEHLYPLHILLFTIPGIPSIYYGSEWGIQGIREKDDKAVRPYINLSDMRDNDLSRFIASLAAIRKGLPSLKEGDYRQVFVSGEVFAFMRRLGSEILVVAVNQSSGQKNVELKIEGREAGEAYDLLDANKKYLIKNGLLQIALKGFYGAILAIKS